jgi:hypothetical protein
MGPETPIRIAGPADAGVVASLIGSFRDYLEGSTPTDEAIEEAVPGLIGDPNTEFLLAGDPEVGFAQVRFRPSVWTGSDDAWLEDVFVLQLEANASNRQAVSLYEGIGFRASHLPERWGEDPDVCFTLELG